MIRTVAMISLGLYRAIGKVGSAMLLTLALTACQEPAPTFNGTDITGTHLGRDLALTDHNGQARTLDDFKSRVTVVFFGFTQCPDVCPTALAELAQVMTTLGPDASRVQVLMITVDPERDTPEILKSYTTAFHPSFLALRGDEAALKKTAGSFRAYFAKSGQPGGSYTMDHTASFYLIDGQGEARVLAGSTIGADKLAEDIRALL